MQRAQAKRAEIVRMPHATMYMAEGEDREIAMGRCLDLLHQDQPGRERAAVTYLYDRPNGAVAEAMVYHPHV